MAISCFGVVCKISTHSCRPINPSFLSQTTSLPDILNIRKSSEAAVETVGEPEIPREGVTAEDFGVVGWKKLSSKKLGITTSMISKPTRIVLNRLREKGYEVYLVGGCVRDLILKKTPKDFDIITSAELKEVRRTFSRCDIVGKRFPICHVHANNTIVEVSSFSTAVVRSSKDKGQYSGRPLECNEHDYLRWRNCLTRDFTINGLMFDPYANLVYDYLGSIKDLRKAKVRTVIPAHSSFQEDCARVLRGVRIAARLGFHFTRETARSIKEFSYSLLKLDKGRILMEINYMMAFGSAEASLRLLWRFRLLEILLPIQAAYFISQGFRKCDKRTNMLLAIFSNLDRLLAPDRPCHSSLWVGILAFHQALVDEPRDPLVVATLTIALRNGGDLLEAVNLSKRITRLHDGSFPELLEPLQMDDMELMDEVLDLASSVKAALSMMTDEAFVSRAMKKYPQAPYSDLVFIPLILYLKVSKIFDFVAVESKEKSHVPKQGYIIDYESLAQGGLQDVRYTFACVVFDSVYPPHSNHILLNE